MVKKRIPKKITSEVRDFIKILRKDSLLIDQVYVFGSYAKGTQHKWSDIDVCVVSPSFHDSIDAMQYLWMKRPKDIGLTIEPVGFHPKDFKVGSTLIDEIKHTGVRVKL